MPDLSSTNKNGFGALSSFCIIMDMHFS